MSTYYPSSKFIVHNQVKFTSQVSDLNFQVEPEIIKIKHDNRNHYLPLIQINKLETIQFKFIDVIPKQDDYDQIMKWIYQGEDEDGYSYELEILNDNILSREQVWSYSQAY